MKTQKERKKVDLGSLAPIYTTANEWMIEGRKEEEEGR